MHSEAAILLFPSMERVEITRFLLCSLHSGQQPQGAKQPSDDKQIHAVQDDKNDQS